MEINKYTCFCNYSTYEKRFFLRHIYDVHKIDKNSNIEQYTTKIKIQIDKNNKICTKCKQIKNNDQYRDENLQCNKCCEQNKKYREQKHVKEKMKEHRKKYYNNNKELIRERTSKWEKERRQNMQIKLIQNNRSRIYKCLKNIKKAKSTKELFDCEVNFLIEWLEYNFTSDMSFNNYGSYWELDHVIPCSSFDLTKQEEQIKCFSWKNVRPLTKEKNNKKNDSIIPFEILMQELKVNTFLKHKRHLQTAGNS